MKSSSLGPMDGDSDSHMPDFSGADVRLAKRALEVDSPKVRGVLDQDGADALGLHARLTSVVDGLVAMNGDLVLPMLRRLEPIREVASTEFDKFVSTTLLQTLFEFSQFVQYLEMLRLEFEHLGLCRENTLLRLQQLAVQFGNRGGDLIEVAQFYQRCSKVLCGLDGGERRCD